MSGSGNMPLTKPVPARERGRKPKEPSTSDNCRCVALFQNKVQQFLEWLDKLSKIVCCPYWKKWDITKVGWPSEKWTFCCPWRRTIFLQKSLLSVWKEPSTSDNCRMCGFCFKTKFSRFETALQWFLKNWTHQQTMNKNISAIEWSPNLLVRHKNIFFPLKESFPLLWF